jgi:hypothetical protein
MCSPAPSGFSTTYVWSSLRLFSSQKFRCAVISPAVRGTPSCAMVRPWAFSPRPKATCSPVAILIWSAGLAQAGGTTMTLYMDSFPLSDPLRSHGLKTSPFRIGRPFRMVVERRRGRAVLSGLRVKAEPREGERDAPHSAETLQQAC